MTFDGRTGMSLTWNDLGLVEKVSLNDTDLVNYSYLADGTKVSALDGDGDGLLYLGSLIYKKTGNSIELESAGFAGGRFVARETSPGVSAMVPMIHVTDHLGSVRAVVDGISGEVVETNDYYPFGGRWDVAAGLKDDTNRFRYNSKEEQFNFGTPYIDYGARQYDPVLGRWFAQDPLAEKYYGISPYAFCAGNPVKYIDPDGKRWVNYLGQVIYDKNGFSAQASMEEIELVKAMLKTRTGTKQLDKITQSPADIMVIINNNEVAENGYGYNTIAGIKYNTSTGKYYPSRECEIVIYKKKAENRSYLLDTYEAMAVNFAHEIEHTTSDNIRLMHEKSSKSVIEKSPIKISRDMIREFYMAKPLDSLDALYKAIHEALQKETNIQINFK